MLKEYGDFALISCEFKRIVSLLETQDLKVKLFNSSIMKECDTFAWTSSAFKLVSDLESELL